jgi:3-methyladenine DNA glycosylase AlkD
MGFDAGAIADALEGDLRAAGRPDRAIQEKRYLKSDLEFAGTTVWQTRSVAKAFTREHPGIGHDDLIQLVATLWDAPLFERRQAAVFLLDLGADLLSPADLPLIERLVRESKTWALVDGLATDVVSYMHARRPDEVAPVLDRWAGDDDFWLRRTSLLAELRPLRSGADLEPFLRRADAMLEEKEFFIRKAIGWVLREVGKRRPDDVADWLAPRTHRASGVTMREAVRYLPAADSARLMAAYRERRPAA